MDRKDLCEKNKNGFTLVEVLVTISITVILAGAVIGFNRGSQKSVVLTAEQGRVLSILSRARSLAQSRYGAGGTDYTCGVKVRLNQNGVSASAIVRSENIKVTDCNSLKNNPAAERPVESFSYDGGVKMKSGPTEIYFESPYLATSFEPSSSSSVVIVLEIPGNSFISKIEVTQGGMVLPKTN